MAHTKEILRRIKSVNNTKKITKAMEMVSASKMRKSVDAVLKTRSYANLSWLTLLNLISTLKEKDNDLHPLLKKKSDIKNVLIVIISSNKGLCGSFNSSIINKVLKFIDKCKKNHISKIDIVSIGQKGAYIAKYGYNVIADFVKNDTKISAEDVIPITNMIIKLFLENKYDKIMVVYTDFVSVSKQVVRIKQILPIEINEDDIGIMGKDSRLHTDKEFLEKKEEKYLSDKKFHYEYIFEPDPYTVLDRIIPRIIQMQLYQALLESNASEHSMRMQAMHQATDAASNMIDELKLYYNKIRQSSITAEIAEISIGANAMK